MAKIPKLIWTEKERAIADLAGQGKEFMQIVNQGYSKNMTSRVMNALKEGQKPEVEQEKDGRGTNGGDGTSRPLVAVIGPKTAPIIFRIDRKEISLDPLELNTQYRFYSDLSRDDGLKYTFSEVLTMGIKLVWFLKQDIPHTEDMLRALLAN